MRKILDRVIHINETERNITSKILESSNENYTVHRCSSNIGIIIFTIHRVTTDSQEFSKAV
jgi:hypothetical protein